MDIEPSSGNVFKDIGFSEFDAKNLYLRSCLMNFLATYIQKKNMNKEDASKLMSVSTHRITQLLKGKLNVFNLSDLFNMMENCGFQLYERVEALINHECKY